MSVIFKTLQKIQRWPLEIEMPNKKQDVNKKQRRKTKTSLFTILIIFLSVSAVMYLGIVYLTTHGVGTSKYPPSSTGNIGKQISSKSYVQKKQGAQQQKTTGFNEAPEAPPPLPPQLYTAEAETVNPVLNEKTDIGHAQVRSEYFPKLVENSKTWFKKDVHSDQNNSLPMYKGGRFLDADIRSTINKFSPSIMGNNIGKSFFPGDRQESNEVPESMPREKTFEAVTSPDGRKIFSEEELENEKQKKILIARLEKSRKISGIVSEIQQSIHILDDSKIDKLINRLESLKGKNNNYVLKLKAFWLLKQADYKNAEPLLAKVLAKDENDIEAGLNMALIEIKTSRIEKAQQRLAKLKNIDSDNILIPEIMKKLRQR